MYVYIICFTISCFLIFLAEKIKNKKISILIEAVGVFLPILLAGCRNTTIGTDIEIYVRPMYDAAIKSSSFLGYLEEKWFVIWRYMYVNQYEPGFFALVYIVSKLFHSLGMVLFFIHLLIVVPIYCGLKKMSEGKGVWLGMLIFYLMHYNVSLNMMRQWIAMAFLFYGFTYLRDKKDVNYFIIVALASLFHVSALFGIVIYTLFVFLIRRKDIAIKMKQSKIKKASKIVLVSSFTICCMLLLDVFVVILESIGLHKFVVYINGDLHILVNQIVVRLPIVVLLILNWKQLKKKTNFAAFYGMMIFLDLIIAQLISINSYSVRIATFFSEYSILSYPALIMCRKKGSIIQRCQSITLILFLIIYWIYYFCIKGIHETVPYICAIG